MTTKIVNDPVHGFIELHPLAVIIIDTPQFQRLRFIKQLGAVYFVYPGASHNRFEHSIGTYHVAGMLMKELQKHSSKSQQRAPPKKEAKSDNNEQMKENKEENNVSDAHEAETPDDRSQDEPYRQESSMEGTTHNNGSQNSDNYEKSKSEETLPQIDDTDILCVQIAALCHNLGHGPFSHVFSSMFIPKVGQNVIWKYEQSSVLMFDVLYEELKESFEYWNIKKDEKQLIKDCIYPERVIKKEEGREFLYEVVSNKRSGVDVNKFDSFARDCIHLGMRSNFDHNRFLKTARLVKYQYPDEKSPIWTIAFRDKDEDEVYQLFHTRRTLHERAYQHPVSKAVEVMITDALIKVNEEVKIKGENGTELKMSDAIKDMVAYTKLTDEVVYRIMNSDPKPDDSEKYCEAREILKRIMMRSLYKVIWKKNFENNGKKHGEKIETKLRECIECQLMGENNNMAEFDQLVVLYRFPLDYGKNKGNPAHNVTFYHKKESTKGIPYDSAGRSAVYPVAKTCFHAFFRSKSKKLTDEECTQIKTFQKAFNKAEDEVKRFLMAN